MSPVSAAAVRLRRLLVRRPWIYWALVILASLGAAASMLERSDRVDAARDSWGSTQHVLVAVGDHAPGDTLVVEQRTVPRAIVAAGAATDTDGLTARQHIGNGEIVHDVDVIALTGPQASTPPGWLAVPVVESPPSGARFGDRVSVVTDGIVISERGLVVGAHDDVTIVAVPGREAPLLAAAGQGRITLLLVP